MKIFMTEMCNQYIGLTRVLAAAGSINKLSHVIGKLHLLWVETMENIRSIQSARDIFCGRKEKKMMMWWNPYGHEYTHKLRWNTLP